MIEYYNYIKALHLIFVITWFAGLFYIVRLFIYQIEASQKPSPDKEILGINLNFDYGSGTHFGPPDNNEIIRNTFRYSPYFRADVGFIYQLWKNEWKDSKSKNMFRSFDNAWLSLEAFNLLDVLNSTSNTWIKTVDNRQFAIPNYTTSRRLNVKFKCNF